MIWRPAKPGFMWEEFLGARASLIQYWRQEGKSYAEISDLLSADESQIRRIDESMQHWHKPEQQEFLNRVERNQNDPAEGK